MTVVLDASAVLAFLQDEDGAEVVERALAGPTRCAAANWSEVAQKVRARERDWDLARALLISFDVEVEDVTAADAEWAAGRWRHRLSLLAEVGVIDRGTGSVPFAALGLAGWCKLPP